MQFSTMHDHMHLLCEADDAEALGAGMQGFKVRLAKGLNREWRRRGSVFAERYHSRALKGPLEVRNALVYVLQNAWKYGIEVPGGGLDPFSSAAWFDGWRGARERVELDPPVAPARSWLLRVGWRRYGEIGVGERPAVPREVKRMRRRLERAVQEIGAKA